MTIFQVIILAIIEGLTEFLPVSSTGHMIIGSSLMGIQSNAFVKLFTVAIQLGTILSVVILYFKRFFQSFDFYFKLLVAFIPAIFFGALFSDMIDDLLESPLAVAISLVLGGIILLYADQWFNKPQIESTDQISYPTAFKIGLMQCLAMLPGVSRSGATIIGGMSQKLSRKAAAEFSFFLAVPTMLGATVKKIWDFYKTGHQINGDELNMLLLGNAIGFIVAIIAIKSFIGYVTKHGFRVFGWYRILVGGIILILLLAGKDLQIV
ncbi:undecaprenyl-diphosphate phosphatase [Pararcticibacter amylolyticus]|uniref:Undecaprenyl-diphosphatase n=1 Tax=Pararcticibacter amylolyticus TaxID=2173175 RepID=A0A2U2PBC0_9SPHI|nr:undecaprenyl-diphosphate phosphatase [Pararcticibacter amylolyticus]PWG78682.1 UDP-diphosphatase [Pararcticibacter amylolyticus]